MIANIRHEQVVYQNPFLCMRIWEIDGPALSEREAAGRRETVSRVVGDSPHWHYHKEVEFLLIREGGMLALLPEVQLELRAGDLALFGSSEPHTTIQTLGPLNYIVFQLDLPKHLDQSTVSSMRYFSEVIRPLSKLNYVFREHADVRAQAAALVERIYGETGKREVGYELAVSAMIKQLLLLVLRNDSRGLLHYSDNPLLERMEPALQYIDRHLADKLLIDDVIKQVNISYYYFIKLFKKAVGMSFSDYVNFKRIKRAEQLILTEERSIADIAESVGIPNAGHFYDMFRRFNGCSPKQFKDMLRDASVRHMKEV